jgi:antitoxin HicB
MKNDIEKQVEYYSNLPYNTVIEKWDDGRGPYYMARVIELPGCMIDGDTPEEAIHEMEDVKPDWIRTNLELGNKMPSPLNTGHYSGKVVLRIPASVHEDLAKMAALEGVSLNQYMVSALSKHLGRDEVLVKEKKTTYKANKNR